MVAAAWVDARAGAAEPGPGAPDPEAGLELLLALESEELLLLAVPRGGAGAGAGAWVVGAAPAGVSAARLVALRGRRFLLPSEAGDGLLVRVRARLGTRGADMRARLGTSGADALVEVLDVRPHFGATPDFVPVVAAPPVAGDAAPEAGLTDAPGRRRAGGADGRRGGEGAGGARVLAVCAGHGAQATVRLVRPGRRRVVAHAESARGAFEGTTALWAVGPLRLRADAGPEAGPGPHSLLVVCFTNSTRGLSVGGELRDVTDECGASRPPPPPPSAPPRTPPPRRGVAGPRPSQQPGRPPPPPSY